MQVGEALERKVHSMQEQLVVVLVNQQLGEEEEEDCLDNQA